MNWLYYLLLHYQTWIQYWIVLISWFGHVVSPRLIAVSPRFQLRSRILRQKLRWFNSNKRKKLKTPKESKANAQWFRIAETRQKKRVHLMQTYLRFTQFLFPIIACISHSKLVKLLQAQLWSVNFTNFFEPIFGGFFNLAQLCKNKTKLKLTIFWKGTVSLSGSS